MPEVTIPERWKHIYDSHGDYLNARRARQCIEELGAAEASGDAKDGYIQFIRKELHKLEELAGFTSRDGA